LGGLRIFRPALRSFYIFAVSMGLWSISGFEDYADDVDRPRRQPMMIQLMQITMAGFLLFRGRFRADWAVYILDDTALYGSCPCIFESYASLRSQLAKLVTGKKFGNCFLAPR